MILIVVGLLVAAAIYRVLRYWISALRNVNVVLDRYRSKDSWALVTGASDGIGLGFVRVLAGAGFNVILCGRNRAKLEGVFEGLPKTSKYKIIISDASDISDGNFDHIIKECDGLDLSLLVNNVGVNHGPRRLDQIHPDKIKEIITVNCTYPTLLTRALLPKLIEHQGPKAIINVSSLAALLPSPKYSVYSASKAFNRSLSLSMSSDYAPGIDVMVCEPGLVATSMTKMRPSLICCSSDECASWTLRRLGSVEEAIPHWKHVLLWLPSKIFVSLTPISLRNYLYNILAPKNFK